ncbi:MAG: response regulator [Hyphomonadaceae bacterium]|nr:response regulator [Hyphomonadaceae bacterium]
MQANNHIGPAREQDTPTALLVEDEVLLRMVLSDHLREAGFQVLEAASGEEARKVLNALGVVDLVITDVHMAAPFEGIELALWMCENYPDIPVIITSASSDVAQSPELAKCRNAVFVAKPYSEGQMESLARSRVRARGASSK